MMNELSLRTGRLDALALLAIALGLRRLRLPLLLLEPPLPLLPLLPLLLLPLLLLLLLLLLPRRLLLG